MGLYNLDVMNARVYEVLKKSHHENTRDNKEGVMPRNGLLFILALLGLLWYGFALIEPFLKGYPDDLLIWIVVSSFNVMIAYFVFVGFVTYASLLNDVMKGEVFVLAWALLSSFAVSVCFSFEITIFAENLMVSSVAMAIILFSVLLRSQLMDYIASRYPYRSFVQRIRFVKHPAHSFSDYAGVHVVFIIFVMAIFLLLNVKNIIVG